MENDYGARWRFKVNDALSGAATVSIRGVVNKIMSHLDAAGRSPVVPLGHGDPSVFPCFRTTEVAEEAIVEAVRSAKYNCYAATIGLAPARSAIAEYLSRDLPYMLSPDNVFLTSGCTQAIEAIISVLARPGANILLPVPGFPFYEARATFNGLEFRHFSLVPERGWEIDLDAVEALADENTVAMVIISPGNPCGNVFTYQHLAKAAVPDILENTKDDFFRKTISILRQAADICYAKLEEIDCITCPHKPEGSMFVMVELSLSYLEDILDDVESCCKLAKEESVIVLPGNAVGLKNWLRITFAIDPSSLEDGLDRLKSFCERHKKQVK